MKVQDSCTRDQLFIVNEKFFEYALKDSIKDIREDLLTKANKEDIEIMSAANDEIKKNVGKFATI
jgi:TRAP-type C4-dicarboxylate transport system substrate-binding protein